MRPSLVVAAKLGFYWGDAALEADLLDLLQHPTPDLKAVVQAHLKKKTNKSVETP